MLKSKTQYPFGKFNFQPKIEYREAYESGGARNRENARPFGLVAHG
jgi:hypothetical protein